MSDQTTPDKPAGSVDHPYAITCAILFSAVAVLVFNVEPIYIGVLEEHLGFTSTQLGILVGIEIGCIGLASLLGVYWVRRVNWQHAMLFGVTALIIGNVTSAFSTSFAALAVLRGLVGLLGEGVIFAVVNTMFGDLRVPARAFALSIFAQVGLGMLGLLLFPAIAAAWGYPGLLVGMTLPAIAAAALLIYFPSGGRELQKTTGNIAAGSIVPVFIGLAVMFFWFVGLSSLWAFIERMGVARGLSQATVGQWLALSLAVGAVSSLAVAYIGNRVGRIWQAPFSISVHLCIGILFVASDEPSIFIFCLIVFTAIWNLGLPYLLELIAEADISGRLFVLFVAAQAAGNTLGPILGGAVADNYGYEAIGYNCSLFCTLALVLYFLFQRRMSVQTQSS